MIIKDYMSPEGRELKPLPEAAVIYPVRERTLTPEERRDYGCDGLQVQKKTCRCCGEEKSAYRFFQNAFTDDGLSLWCKSCWYRKQAQKEKRLRAKRRKGRRNRGGTKEQWTTKCG